MNIDLPDDFWKVNIGQVLQIISFLFGGVLGCVALLKSVWLNRSMTAQNSRDITELKADMGEMRDDVREIRGMAANFMQANQASPGKVSRERWREKRDNPNPKDYGRE